MLEMLELPYHL